MCHNELCEPKPGGSWENTWTYVQKGRQLSSLPWICLLHCYQHYEQGKNKAYLAREDPKWVRTRYENFSLNKQKFFGGNKTRNRNKIHNDPKRQILEKPKRINMANSQQMLDISVISSNNINYKAPNLLLNNNYIKRGNYIKRY